MTSNKKAGNDFEQEFCQMLSDDGYWAHNMANRKNGQPADIIASKDNRPYLIDCKDCENDIFKLSRVEENQHYAMRKWELCGNGQGLFALNTSKGVYMLRYGTVQVLEIAGVKALVMRDIETYCATYKDWVEGRWK